MNHFRLFLLFWIALSLSALPGVSLARQSGYGERPASGVFDPHGLLDAETLRGIADPLQQLLLEDGIDVVVVVLEDLGDAPPEFVAQGFALAWCSAPAHAIVLHVPSHAGSPWIVPGGNEVANIQRSVLNARLYQATRNAERESSGTDKLRVATEEAADMLRLWSSGTMVHDEMASTARKHAVEQFAQEQRARKMRVYVLAVAAALLVTWLFVLLLWWSKPRHRIFPDVHPARRLGAPHGGGNHVVVDFSSPTNPDR